MLQPTHLDSTSTDVLKLSCLSPLPDSKTLSCYEHRTERTAEQGDADDVAQTKRRQPLGLLPAAAIGSLIGVASAMLYLWCMERQRQNDLAWEYYRTH